MCTGRLFCAVVLYLGLTLPVPEHPVLAELRRVEEPEEQIPKEGQSHQSSCWSNGYPRCGGCEQRRWPELHEGSRQL
uniref:Putative secreted protein n=1 Tax=Anopheles triannulatus TaxID=58253 RepID=A0A2M4B3J9_9DIPT